MILEASPLSIVVRLSQFRRGSRTNLRHPPDREQLDKSAVRKLQPYHFSSQCLLANRIELFLSICDREHFH